MFQFFFLAFFFPFPPICFFSYFLFYALLWVRLTFPSGSFASLKSPLIPVFPVRVSPSLLMASPFPPFLKKKKSGEKKRRKLISNLGWWKQMKREALLWNLNFAQAISLCILSFFFFDSEMESFCLCVLNLIFFIILRLKRA